MTPRRDVTGLSGEKVTTPEEEGAQSRYRKVQTQDGKVGYIASIYLAKHNYQRLTQKVPLIAQPEHVANEQSDTQPSIVLCEVSEKKASLWNTPNMDSMVGVVECCESVTILSPLSRMTKVRAKDGSEGYLRGTLVGFASPTMPAAKLANTSKQEKIPRVERRATKICGNHPSWSHNECKPSLTG